VVARENVKVNNTPSTCIVLCGVIDHVAEVMEKGFEKVMESIKSTSALSEKLNVPEDRFKKYTKKTKELYKENKKAIAEALKHFK